MRETAKTTAIITAAALLAFTLPSAQQDGAMAAQPAGKAATGLALPGETAADAVDALLGKRVWYEGGTLHRSTLDEWADATARNRLATAGDWTARMFSPKRLYGMGLQGIRTHAEAIVACVDDVADSGRNGAQQSSRVAMACHLSLMTG